jgi:hypothetical protein
MCSNHHLAHITVSVLTAAVEVDVLLAAADVARSGMDTSFFFSMFLLCNVCL